MFIICNNIIGQLQEERFSSHCISLSISVLECTCAVCVQCTCAVCVCTVRSAQYKHQGVHPIIMGSCNSIQSSHVYTTSPLPFVPFHSRMLHLPHIPPCLCLPSLATSPQSHSSASPSPFSTSPNMYSVVKMLHIFHFSFAAHHIAGYLFIRSYVAVLYDMSCHTHNGTACWVNMLQRR